MKRFSKLTVTVLTVFLLAVPGFAHSTIFDFLSNSYWKSGIGIFNPSTKRAGNGAGSNFKSGDQLLVSTTIVISEFRTRGPNGASDEFVEICNISAGAVDISGYRLNGSNNTGVVGLRATVPANTSLPAGGRYLFINTVGYSGTVPGNQGYTTGITDDGGLAILTPAAVIVDQVGMSAGSAYKEGTTLAPTASNVNQSYERKSGVPTANLQDTDNNANDFQFNASTSNPQNSSLSASPASLSFGSVATGQSSVLNVTVNSLSSTTISTPVIFGANASDFSAGTPSPSTGTSFTIPVTFAPQSTGDKTAVLNVTTVHGSVSVPLSGTGAAAVMPTLEINDVAQSEGNAGTTNFTFTVSLNTATHEGVTFDIATADGTATDDNPTIEDNDYTANSLTGQVIPNGSQTYSFTVAVNGDSADEPDETFFVNITNVAGANVSDGQGQGAITNDDVAAASVEFSDTNYTEDESQTANLTVLRTGDLSGTTTVNYTTQNPAPNRGVVLTATGGASCAAGVDFIHQSGTLTFGVEDDFEEIQIELCPDSIIEQPEAFNVYLSNVTNGTLGDIQTAQVSINDTANDFTNAEPIFIGTGGDSYESSLEVSGVPTNIGGMRVTLFDFEHLTADDIDVLLVGPQGQKFLLMGDAGGDDGLVEGATLTFSDNAGQVLPDASQIFTGVYEPTTWIAGQTSFPAPAPAAPYAEPGSAVGGPVTFASVFGNTNANGVWTLYIRDDDNAFQKLGSDGAVFGGWGLQFLAPTAAGVSVGGNVRAGKTPVSGATVMLTGGNLAEPLVARTNSFGNYRFEGLPVGETYIVTIVSNRYEFPQSSIILNLSESVDGADFEAEDR